MATRREADVYAAGLVQGIVLVTFRRRARSHRPGGIRPVEHPVRDDVPAPGGHGHRRVGAGGSLARRFGTKRVYPAGLVANLASMALLIVSQFFTTDQAVAYGLLLGATACLGAGFGLTAPALNSFTAVFHPAEVDRSILVLNALLGLGTALAPVFVAIFDGLGFWWGLPLLSAALLAGLLAVSLPLPLRAGAQARGAGGSMAASRPGSGSSPPSPSSTASARP